MSLYISLSERLKTQHFTIKQLVSGINVDKLTASSAPGKWSALDNIAHLTRYQKIFTDRVHRILDEDTPVFDRYNGDLDVEFTSFRSMNLAQLLDIISADRVIITDLLSGLSEAELCRIGVHPKYGRLTILKWAEFFVLHEAHHLFTIFQLVNGSE
ncbi:DinB family protein [Mucilaginibacter sp. SMC90]|uniref:DinB family protein n=1 Tax=Mucilaginibacter sp. SMC90 TaxID=2929803 RepID=UPI001FB41DF4|nr:DinB family protein [Mucilaginibacter sp. SMC90]UOE48884.1 DinB family protein [Mucilaginibacter sp. SMC90]